MDTEIVVQLQRCDFLGTQLPPGDRFPGLNANLAKDSSELFRFTFRATPADAVSTPEESLRSRTVTVLLHVSTGNFQQLANDVIGQPMAPMGDLKRFLPYLFHFAAARLRRDGLPDSSATYFVPDLHKLSDVDVQHVHVNQPFTVTERGPAIGFHAT